MRSLPGPGSISWRVNAEAALLLGGGRALLMQVAHPQVAAGVADHSDFERDPLRRLARTLELSLALTFGSEAEINASARQINRRHERVTGAGYRALDPDLLLWVHATLLDSAMVTYRTFVGRLDDAEAEEYYQEAKPIGGLLGIPFRRYPAHLQGFNDYLAGMLAGPARPDAVGLRLAPLVLRPSIRAVPGFAFMPLEAVTAGLLPAELRSAYGLAWGRRARAAFGALRATLPGVISALPARVRLVPPAREAARRLQRQFN